MSAEHLDNRADAYMLDHPVSYGEALDAVAAGEDLEMRIPGGHDDWPAELAETYSAAQPDRPAPQVGRYEESDIDRELDRMVDTRGISYAQARRELGLEVSPVPTAAGRTAVSATTRRPGLDALAAQQRRRRTAAHGPQYGEERGVGLPGGLPPEHQPRAILDADQLLTLKRGHALASGVVAGTVDWRNLPKNR